MKSFPETLHMHFYFTPEIGFYHCLVFPYRAVILFQGISGPPSDAQLLRIQHICNVSLLYSLLGFWEHIFFTEDKPIKSLVPGTLSPHWWWVRNMTRQSTPASASVHDGMSLKLDQAFWTMHNKLVLPPPPAMEWKPMKTSHKSLPGGAAAKHQSQS